MGFGEAARFCAQKVAVKVWYCWAWDVYGISVGEFQETVGNTGQKDVKNLGLITQLTLEPITVNRIIQEQCIE